MMNKLVKDVIDFDPIMPIAALKPLPQEAFETLVDQIRAFERSLAASEAVAVMLASFGQSILLQVHKVSRAGLYICMEGVNSDGREARLVQHFTQVSLMLVKVDLQPEKPRQPIGFVS